MLTSLGVWGLPQMVHKFYAIESKESIRKGTVISTVWALIVGGAAYLFGAFGYAVLGGESSGGLTVRGHIHGKDSVYAASLFAEMVSVIGKSPSEILAELEAQYGRYILVEKNLRFAPEYKKTIENILLVEKKLPQFAAEIDHVGYADGCKVYFKDGSFINCRFSGTEPLLRIFAESSDAKIAEQYIAAFRQFLKI